MRLAVSLIALSAAPALAAPEVVTDIAPIHSLVARVMDGVGEPVMLLDGAVSPHDFALRPSQARAIEGADLVIQNGMGLAPWLDRALDATGTASLSLMSTEGTILREVREGALFDADERDHGHGHDDDHGDDHAQEASADGHDDHGDDDHGDHEAHDDGQDHDRGDDGHDEHAEGDHDHDDAHGDHADDPHGWLDPRNGAVWLTTIADALSEIDPENADVYAANAAAGIDEITAAEARIAETVAPIEGRAFVVAHDAYISFEDRFGLSATGAIAAGDAAAPGPARVQEVRDRLQDAEAACLFLEPQMPDRLALAAAEGTNARIATIDPFGSDLTPGPALYVSLLEDLASDIAGCLTDPN